MVAWREDFEDLALGGAPWRPDDYPDDGPFSDAGAWFTARGVVPPLAFRATLPFGADGWLTAEAYTRDASTRLTDLLSVTPDPAAPANRVLRIASRQHTDATVVRPTVALPLRYRISVRVGYADFGDGVPGGPNGYDGDEQAGPWRDASATTDNGFYWLTILDARPRPHNNQWIHHHRKVVIDSDNHDPPFLSIWDGGTYRRSGEHPVMMFVLDGRGRGNPTSGQPFIAWSAGQWQAERDVGIRAADAYRDQNWYTAVIERDGDSVTLEVTGDLRFGGRRTYRATLDLRGACGWHFPRVPAEIEPGCARPESFAELPGYPLWPADGTWPDWFMFGDPHNNYYEGQVFYDDVQLEVWRD